MIKEYQEKFAFTAIIVSHDIPGIFDIAQRIAMLDDGTIKFEGSKNEILDSQGHAINAFIQGDDV
jgi:phospholipid/cholesterol/gamma-HCH transport system ATP-binding protein